MGRPRATGVLTALVLTLAAGPVPHARATLADVDVLHLEPYGGPQATRFATQPGLRYTIRVTGMYTYTGYFAFVDCGHRDPADPRPWVPDGSVLLDGEPAHCLYMPYDETHSYSWPEEGTGSPFVFEIARARGDTDDLGAMVVTVVEG